MTARYEIAVEVLELTVSIDLTISKPLFNYSKPVLTVHQFRSGNGNPSKNPNIKTQLVVSFSLEVAIHFSPLVAFRCQGSSIDSY